MIFPPEVALEGNLGGKNSKNLDNPLKNMR